MQLLKKETSLWRAVGCRHRRNITILNTRHTTRKQSIKILFGLEPHLLLTNKSNLVTIGSLFANARLLYDLF